MITGLSSLPWLVKPLYGFIRHEFFTTSVLVNTFDCILKNHCDQSKKLGLFYSDSVPLFGYRRRSYLVLSGLLGAFSWSLMAGFVDSKYSAASCILLGSLSVAFSDVVSFLIHSGNVSLVDLQVRVGYSSLLTH